MLRQAKLFFFIILIFLSGISSISCGYSTSGSTLASHLRTIHVENIKNSIEYTVERRRNVYFPLLEIDIRNAVIDRFQFDGNLRISEADVADLILKAELINYDRGALRYTDNDDVEEYRIFVVVSMEMWDMTTKELMWSESSFAGEATYFITGPEISSEQSAVDEAVEDLARRIVERLIEDW